MTNADTTLAQLGGSGRLNVMIGAKHFMHDNDGQTLSFKFKSCKVGSYVRITLNSLDLYDVEFVKPGRMNRKTFTISENKTTGEFQNVPAESLKNVFESFTGLLLTL